MRRRLPLPPSSPGRGGVVRRRPPGARLRPAASRAAGWSTAPARRGSGPTCAWWATASPPWAVSTARAAQRRIDASRSGRRPRLHRHARPVRVQRARRQPRRPARSPRASPPRSRARAARSPPPNARMLADGRGDLRALRRHAATSPPSPATGGLSSARRPAINLGTFVGAGGVRDLVIGEERPRGRRRDELRADGSRGGPGDGGGRLRPLHLAAVRARPLRHDRGDRRARQGGRALRRQLHHPPALRGRRASTPAWTRCSGSPARPAIPARDLPPEDRRQAELGPDAGGAERASRRRAAEGLDVTADQYPYVAGSNALDASLPLWVREGGRDKMVARLRDPAHARADARPSPRSDDRPGRTSTWAPAAPRGILVVERREPRPQEVRGPHARARSRTAESKDPVDVIMDIVIADRGNTGAASSFMMSEDDVRAALRHPLVSILHRLRAAWPRTASSRRRIAPAGLGLGGAHPRPATCARRSC